MTDQEMTRTQLLDEVKRLRERVKALETADKKRQEVEQEYLRAASRFSKTFHNAPLLMSISRIEDGTYIDVNQAFIAVSGFTREEVIGTKSTDLGFISSEDRQKLKEAIIRDGRIVNLPLKLRHRNGADIHCLYSGEIIELDGEKRLLSIASDITELRTVEDALRESEERLQQIIQQMPYPVEICDIEGNATLVNKKFLELFGIPTADYVIDHYNVFRDKLVMEILGLSEEIRRVFAGVVVFLPDLEIPYEQIDYREFGVQRQKNLVQEVTMFPVFRPTGEVWRVVTIWKDISERKRAERALLKSESKLRSLLEASPDAITLVDLSGGILDCNQATLDLLGVSKKGDIVQKSAFNFFAEESQQRLRELLQESIHHRVIRNIEFTLIRPDNSQLPVEISLSVLRDSDDQPSGFISIARDITERKAIEQNMRQTLNEKTTLLQELYHRTKNNMQVIASMLELKSGYMQDEQITRFAQEIGTKIRTMALVHQKLYESRDLSSINMQDFVQDLVALLMKGYDVSPMLIKTYFEVAEVYLLMDIAIPCGLVINELVSNSLLHAFPDDRTGQIRVEMKRNEEGKIELVIADDGVGIPANLDLRVSESLGVQTVVSLIEFQLNGTIRWKSNGGLTCYITFPDDMYHKRVT